MHQVDNHESDTDQSEKWEQKKLGISRWTESLRRQFLDQNVNKLKNQGWELFEYHEAGIFKSYAVFRRPLADPSKYNTPSAGKLKPWKELSSLGKIWRVSWMSMVLAIGLGFISSFFESEEAKVQRVTAENNKQYELFLNKNLSSVKGSQFEKEKKIGISSFLEKNDLSPQILPDFYNFLSQKIHEKNGDLKVVTVLEWGKNEIIANEGSFKQDYYDLDNIESQFSAWDGSHTKLETLIKLNMHDESSYEHVETRYGVVLHGEGAPYMQVATTYSGKNLFGARLKGRVVGKVSIIDGTVLEIIE